MCTRCLARHARVQARVWCIEIAVAFFRGVRHSTLIEQAADVSAWAQALEPGVVS